MVPSNTTLRVVSFSRQKHNEGGEDAKKEEEGEGDASESELQQYFKNVEKFFKKHIDDAKKKPGMIAEKQEEAAAQEARDNSGAIVHVDETKPLVF